jgi:hypothetical protein
MSLCSLVAVMSKYVLEHWCTIDSLGNQSLMLPISLSLALSLSLCVSELPL